jgi:hypothetical protein
LFLAFPIVNWPQAGHVSPVNPCALLASEFLGREKGLVILSTAKLLDLLLFKLYVGSLVSATLIDPTFTAVYSSSRWCISHSWEAEMVELSPEQEARYWKAYDETRIEWERRCNRRRFVLLAAVIPAAVVMIGLAFNLRAEQPIISKGWDVAIFLLALAIVAGSNFWPAPERRQVYKIDFADRPK